MFMLNPLSRKVGAELIGTYALVTAGGGAIIASSQGNLPPLGVAFAFGITIAVMIAAVGHISGGHLNPSVSIAMALTRHMPVKDMVGYIVGQFLGATLGALTLLAIFGQKFVALTVNAPAAHVGTWQAVGVEVVITAFLMFVITSVATDAEGVGKLAAFAIGATITLGALWGGPVSSGSMNPARSFGPALVAGNWTDLWIYFVGPIVGAAIGALLYQLIRQPAQAGKTASTKATSTPTQRAEAKR